MSGIVMFLINTINNAFDDFDNLINNNQDYNDIKTSYYELRFIHHNVNKFIKEKKYNQIGQLQELYNYKRNNFIRYINDNDNISEKQRNIYLSKLYD